ncbi:MAG TPA: hypothetical protein P5531_05455 [Bacteroidales bacterium]|nr:hypothetical protein [Bacteroidales bacterium]HSA42853.1 hypothetical protein [Bacteroidales bacterium]
MESNTDYNFNLFRPLTKYGRKNRNMIITLLCIWVVAVFGFQILLRVMQKPVAEPTLERFQEAWARQGDPDPAVNRQLVQSLLLVAGKNVLKPADRNLLNQAITFYFYGMTDDSSRTLMMQSLEEMKELKTSLGNSKDEAYLQIKDNILAIQQQMINESSRISGLSPGSLESQILISSLQPELPAISPDGQALAAVMKHYLTHNQSVLTDKKFLGFPFHYFYTAVFLLVLFVGLCLAYNILLGRRQRLEGIEE